MTDSLTIATRFKGDFRRLAVFEIFALLGKDVERQRGGSGVHVFNRGVDVLRRATRYVFSTSTHTPLVERRNLP